MENKTLNFELYMFRFGNIEYLNFLFAVPVMLILLLFVIYSRRRALERYGNREVICQLMPEAAPGKHVLKYLLLLGTLVLLILGIARPQFGSKLREVKREGVELIIALDVSNSMLAEDIAPNRLERAKQAISKLVDRLINDRIGLIVFAGDAYVQVPITTDYVSVKLFLESISTEIVPKQGTAIGAAIEMGMKSFTPAENKSKALIIITDGENHEDDALESARLAREKGITIHAIGIGSPEGSPIPLHGMANQRSYRKDKQGEIVISKLNERILQEIAATGDGVYVKSTDSHFGLNAVFDEINKMEKQEMDAKIYSDFDERFQYMFGAGLILLIIEFLILERKNRWLSRIKLFER